MSRRGVPSVQSIGQVMRQVRTEKGLSQAAVAERVGCSHQTVGRLESGQSVALVWVLNLLTVYGLSWQALGVRLMAPKDGSNE